MDYQIFVPGKPLGKGRPRLTTHGGHAHAYTPAQTIKYEKLINQTFREKYPEVYFKKSDYLEVDLVAAMPIPKSFTKKQKEDARTGLLLPATRTSDVDNIAKSALDGLQGDRMDGPIPDDKQVVALRIVKVYAEEPGLTIKIIKLN